MGTISMSDIFNLAKDIRDVHKVKHFAYMLLDTSFPLILYAHDCFQKNVLIFLPNPRGSGCVKWQNMYLQVFYASISVNLMTL